MMGVCNHKVAIVGWVQSQQCDHWGLITGGCSQEVLSQGCNHKGMFTGE